jgi:hypothetical protein
MPFVDVQLSDVELEKPSPVPVGSYKFKLQPGAAYRESKFSKDIDGNPVQELNVRLDVIEGDFAGRPVFVSYPDPTAISKKDGKPMKFAAQALKVLEIALGVDSVPGEDPATYLNRVATSGNSLINGTMIDNSYTKNGQTVTQAKFGIFSPTPAA